MLEIIIVIAITAIISSACIVKFTAFTYAQNAYLTLQQLKSAINYARSEAILHKQIVTICPSYNRVTCSDNWTNGILVTSSNAKIRYFTTFTPQNTLFTLEQSGFSNILFKIQADGMTYTNGHFAYKSLNSGYIPSFNLYFNKALRVYVR